MTESEKRILVDLKGCKEKVAYFLYNYQPMRDVNTDEFIKYFRLKYSDSIYGMETIRRARQFVQNTKKFCSKKSKNKTWIKPIRELRKTNIGETCQMEMEL